MRAIALAVLALSIGACAAKAPPPKAAPIPINKDPYPSTYQRYPGAIVAMDAVDETTETASARVAEQPSGMVTVTG